MYSFARRGAPTVSHANPKKTSSSQVSSMVAQRSILPKGKLTIGGILQMQRMAGNQAVQAMLAERAIQRLPESEEEELQMKAEQTNQTGMPTHVKQKMEAAFQTDFSDVRIHQGNEAREVGALAYTKGTDIHFAPGQYQPETDAGQQLLGHELAHVIQQKEGRVKPTTSVKGVPVNDDPSLEQEADQLGAKAAQFSLPSQKNEPIQQKKDSTSAVQPLAIQRDESNEQAAANAVAKDPYSEIYEYLEKAAKDQNKTGLYNYFMHQLDEGQRRRAIDMLMGSGPVTPERFKKKMHSYWHRIQHFSIKGKAKTVNWDRFSEAIRAAYAQKELGKDRGITGLIEDNADTIMDKGLSALGAVSEEIGQVTGTLGSGLNMVTGAFETSENIQELRGNLDVFTSNEAALRITRAAVGASDTAQNAASAIEGLATAAGSGSDILTGTVAGLGLLTGTYNTLAGGTGVVVNEQRRQNLNKIAEKSENRDIRMIALAARDKARLERDMSAFQAAQGALQTAAGLGLIMAPAAAPAVAVVAGLAAVLGGIKAIYQYFKKKSLKKDVVDRYLNLDKLVERIESSGQKADRERLRKRILHTMGYNTVDQYYDVLMDRFAEYLYEHGVERGPDDQSNEAKEAREILKELGYEPTEKDGVKHPTKAEIKKALSL